MAKKDDEIAEVDSSKFLKSFMLNKQNKSLYYKKVEHDYRISSGSILLDEMIGTLAPCMFRFYGASGGGKTSCMLSYMKDFLETVPKAKGIYFKSEGRFSDTLRNNSGISFVDDEIDWQDGKCIIIETNFYEGVFNLVEQLIKGNFDNKFFFIVDSMDGLILQGDGEKDFSEAIKVAGGATLSTLAMKKLSVPLSAGGHYLGLISQQRANIKTNAYTHEVNQMKLDSSGGNALIHFPDVILEFYTVKVDSQYFESNEDINPARPKAINDFDKMSKDQPVGHMVRGFVRKSDSNVQNMPLAYPIRYDRPGECIWWEREVMLKLIADSWISIKTTGNVVPEDGFNELLSNYDIPEFEPTKGKLNAERALKESGALELFWKLFKKENRERHIVDEKGRRCGFMVINAITQKVDLD
jgi:hypothetical protein